MVYSWAGSVPLFALSLILLLAGCGPSASRSQAAAAASQRDAVEQSAGWVMPELPAQEIVHRLEQAYQQAAAYADRGRVVLRYRERGDIREDAAPLAVSFDRQGRLRVEAYHALVVCDGEQLFARVKDDLSHDLDGQVLRRRLDGPLTLDQLYRDAVLNEQMSRGLGGRPVQLDLLFGQPLLQGALSAATNLHLLPMERVESQPCYRVAAETPRGPVVLWIDVREFLLRRLDLPAAAIVPDLAALPGVRDLELFVEFRGASFKPIADDTTFRLDLPPGARPVQVLLLPPHPLPSDLFGRLPGDFALTRGDGQKLGPRDFQGQIVVLLWFNNHPACRITLEQLNAVYAEQPIDNDLRMLAVATEPASVPVAQLEGVLREWNVGVPLVRDLQACGRDVFRIPWAPALIVLDREGKVQIFEVGANPNLARELPVILQRLRQGDDLASEIVAAHEWEKAEYQRLLQIAGQEGDPRAIELALANIKPRSMPQQFALQAAWKIDAVSRPGNLLGQQRTTGSDPLLVLEGDATVVELSREGNVLGRHPLQLDGEPVTQLAAAQDGNGQPFYLASARPARSVCLFDAAWRRVGRYPAPEHTPADIVAAELVDWEHDGSLEVLLGFAGPHGVMCLGADGALQWSNTSITSVLSLTLDHAASGSERWLLVTTDRGDLSRFDRRGEPAAPIKVAGKNVFHLFAARNPESASPYCGLTYSEAGNLVALGLNAEFQEVWSYPLPPGIFRYPTRSVTSGKIGDDDFWCLAAPDGTVHWVRADGQVSDHFAVGEEIRGIELLSGLLVISSRAGVEAWRVAAPAQ